MKALIAIDSMKGSITSVQANTIVQKVFEKSGHEASCVSIADGGEGTLEALLEHDEGERIQAEVHDLKMEKVSIEFGWVSATKTAILETSIASGIQYLDSTKRTHPKNTSSYGTGELIVKALDKGAKKIIIGLGGTGTVDGGIGLATALGVEFFDKTGTKLNNVIGKNLQDIYHFSVEKVDPRIFQTDIVAVSDVDNFLVGEFGSVKMFGQQKGILSAEIEEYEAWMNHYAQTILYEDGTQQKGDGAAGGIGAALRFFFHAKICSGFEFIAKKIDLEQKISTVDLVITGEGKMDNQSLHGKVPVGVSLLAKKYQIPTIAFVGAFEGDIEKFIEVGIVSVIPIVDSVMTLPEALQNAASNLERAALRTVQLLDLFNSKKK